MKKWKQPNLPTIHIHSQITPSGDWVVVTANKHNKTQQILSKLIQFSAFPQVQFQAGLKRMGANTDHLLWVNCNLKSKTPIPSQLQCSTTIKVLDSTKMWSVWSIYTTKTFVKVFSAIMALTYITRSNVHMCKMWERSCSQMQSVSQMFCLQVRRKL